MRLDFISRIEDKLKIHSQYRIEADAIPTCLIHYPSGRFEEEFLFTANDKFKLRFVAIPLRIDLIRHPLYFQTIQSIDKTASSNHQQSKV